MQLSKVETLEGEDVLVQGFKGDVAQGIAPYVFVGVFDEKDDGDAPPEFTLTPENAHILSEEIRKHAEFASAEQGE